MAAMVEMPTMGINGSLKITLLTRLALYIRQEDGITVLAAVLCLCAATVNLARPATSLKSTMSTKLMSTVTLKAKRT